MKKQIITAPPLSGMTFSDLEPFVREKIPNMLQAILKEEVTDISQSQRLITL